MSHITVADNSAVVMVRNFPLLVLAFVGVVSVGFGVHLYIEPLHESPPTSLLPAQPVASPPSVAPQASAPEPVLQDVGLFMPTSLDVFTPRGQLNPKKVDIFQGELRATATGVDPPDQPAVLTDPATTLPGTGQGTTVITGHAQINPPKVFNFLSDLTQEAVDDGSNVVLYGSSGQELVYDISAIRLIDKATFDTHKEFQDRTPNRLLIITCNLANGSDTAQNRVVIANLVSSKAGV